MDRSYFVIKVFVLIDNLGEWWESVKTDNSLKSLGNPKERKFHDLPKAKSYAKRYKKFKIIEMIPPLAGKITYREKVVFEQSNEVAA